MTISVENKITQILSVFETGKPQVDYAAVFTYSDGLNKRRQVTLSYGFTEDGGNLKKLLQLYIMMNGKYANQFAYFLPKIGQGVLCDSDEFKNLLRLASLTDSFFNTVQEFAFKAFYIKRGYDKANEYRVATNLGVAVVSDSVLHGSFDTVAAIVESTGKMRPAKGGSEKVFITEYLKARTEWLTKKGGQLAETIYRPASFQYAVQKGDWDMVQPFNANGTIV